MLEKVPTEVLQWLSAKCEVATNGCWVWRGSGGANDRPTFFKDGRSIAVRRMLVEFCLHADAMKNWIVHRRCETRGCVHPDHLHGGPTETERLENRQKWYSSYYRNNRDAYIARASKQSLSPEARARRNQRRVDARAAQREAAGLPPKKTISEQDRAEHQRARWRKWKADNKHKVYASNKAYALRYPEKAASAQAKRRAERINRTPAWLTAEHKAEIDRLYTECRVASESGVLHDVDHLCPLRGATISGLHVPWNLRVVTRADNEKKRNTVVEVLCMPAFIN